MLEIETLVITLLPAVVSFAIALPAFRLPLNSVCQRYTLPVALAVSFLVGYILLPSWAELVPKRHWQWLPYLGLLAAACAPAGLSKSALWRWLPILMICTLGAWLIVPTWSNLQPSRSAYIAMLVGYLLLLNALLAPLPNRMCDKLFLALLTVTATALALFIAASVSLRYGRVSGVVAAGMAGCCAARYLAGDVIMATRSLVPVFTILVGGAAFVGFIEPQPPLVGILLVPAAPLALWLCTWRPLSSLQGRAASAAQIAVVFGVLLTALALV